MQTAAVIALLVLWIPVALDKFADLEAFRRTLLRQPFPDAWTDFLYWMLPAVETACAVLLVGGTMDSPKTTQLRKWGFALSSLLLLGFTFFILCGVLGWHPQRPCGCGSVISDLSWEQHLWFNLAFLAISLTGWWTTCLGGDHPSTGSVAHVRDDVSRDPPQLSGNRSRPFSSVLRRFRYPRRFALFPGRPVH